MRGGIITFPKFLLISSEKLVVAAPPRNFQLVWHPGRLIKEGGCVDLSLNNMHLNDPLVLFRSKGSALTLPLSLLNFTNVFGNISWH